MTAERLNGVRSWPMALAWRAASEAAAMFFEVSPLEIQAPSRGRGPKPMLAIRTPKKVAIYLAVILSDADYAHLGKVIGMHKDTVRRHCAELRAVCAASGRFDGMLDAIYGLALAKLEARERPSLIAADRRRRGLRLIVNRAAPLLINDKDDALHPTDSPPITAL